MYKTQFYIVDYYLIMATFLIKKWIRECFKSIENFHTSFKSFRVFKYLYALQRF